ncbi:MAG: ATP-dependent Clp protease ATP-binding subunit [Oscillospiraceae bacterium]
MFKFSGFTGKANAAVNAAIEQACILGHTYVGSEHLLLGLLEEESGIAGNILRGRGVEWGKIRQKLIETVGRGIKTQMSTEHFTPRCRKSLENALAEARMLGQNIAGTEHILLSMLKERESYAVRFLKEIGVDCGGVYRDAMDLIGSELVESLYLKGKKQAGKPKTAVSRCPNLEKYSRDLTQWAKEGKLDPVIGRDEEISRTLQILSRRTKNNPCLIGEAGVGKTAVAEGLAQLLLTDAVPQEMQETRILSLDLTNMIAGTKFRGEFEERVRACLQEVVDDGNIILFIDEIHTIMGAGAAEGAIDAANILKPQLARGELRIIGATTLEEYRKHIEKDGALARRFQSVEVLEPSPEKTLEILKGLRTRYENHHSVQITDEALETAVSLSERYLTDRFLPDKAIDLMDEAAACVRLNTEKTALCAQRRFAMLTTGEDRALGERWHSDHWPSESEERQQQSAVVTAQNIAQVTSKMTGIPTEQLMKDQNKRLLELEERLHDRIIGQEEAVCAVAKAIRRSRSGMNDPNRPIGSFLFLGPSGVGKTELCRALSEALFAREDAMIRIDMSEYMEKHAVSRLIGTPPGYVGYEEGGQLTEKVRQNPYSVVLFDEVEKAHPDIFHLLLQVLDEGHLTDSAGRRVNFKNCVIIMTSNIGAQKIAQQKNLGFGTGSVQEQNMKREVQKELKTYFRPEFLNRIDEILFFQYLTRPQLEKIGARMIGQLQRRLRQIGVNATIAPEAVTCLLEQKDFNPAQGARLLKSEIRKRIEDPLAQQYLAGSFSKGDEIFCEMGEELIVHKIMP